MCYDQRVNTEGGDNMTPNQLAAKLAGSDHAERIGKAFDMSAARKSLRSRKLATVTASPKAEVVA